MMMTTGRHRGFTMIELMVSIVIVAILAALTLSIGSAVLESSEKRRTHDMLSLLDAAVLEYEQTMGRPITYGDNGKPLGSHEYDIDVAVYNQSHQSGIGFLEDWSVDADGFFNWETAVAERAGRRLMVKLLDRLERVESCRSMLARIEPDFWERMGSGSDPDNLYLLDSWGRPVTVVFAGRDWYDRSPRNSGLNDFEDAADDETIRKDADGTIRTFEERAFGPALNGRLYFMSAGPDQRYGWLGHHTPIGQYFVPDQDDTRYRRTQDNLYSYEVRQW